MIHESKRALLLFSLTLFQHFFAQAQAPAIDQFKSYPYPTELTAASGHNRIAFAFDEQGRRNVYVAEGPSFAAKKLTAYNEDDGQEISSLMVSGNGKWVLYVRGGDHGSNWDDDKPVNVNHTLHMPKVQIWVVPFEGGEAKTIAEGDDPALSPKADSVVFIKGGQAWIATLDAKTAARALFTTQGTTGSLQFSPDGSKLAFVSNRGDRSYIGVYTFGESIIQWISPSFKRDHTPRWSPDGRSLVFIRTNGGGGAPDSLLVRRHQPWTICTADIATGKATELYRSPATLQGSIPTTHGGYNLQWAAKDRIVFLSYMDGWPHLYSLPAAGGAPMLLTPGEFMAEHIRLSPDGAWLYFAANTGPDALDIDRRHVARVAVDRPLLEVLTPGTGLEWSPVPLADGSSVAIISATAQRPPLPAVTRPGEKTISLLAQDHIPSSFPHASMVIPKQVIFKAADGVTVHAQLFEPPGGNTAKKPAVVYVHGGPPRQMLLGWHYSDYYANAYATNQYLASKGFVVLSVNYRLGIGYGFKFHQPNHGGRLGASEYADVKAAGQWLAAQPFVDKSRIGIYGGSYGGYLTALGLGRDSKLFAAVVDIHGVHDWTTSSRNATNEGGYEKIPDLDSATHLAYLSSPVATVKKWTSPVLIIHGDDDRNVRFSQSTDLVRRLEKQGVPVETMVIVGDTHHWMKHANAVKVDEAIADFFVRKFLKKI